MLKKCALIKIILIFLFPIDYVGCHEWYVHENSSFRLPTSILNEILFIYFHIPPFSLRCFLKSFADQESGFFCTQQFCPLVPGRMFPGHHVPHQRENAQELEIIETLLSNMKGQEEELSNTFNLKPVFYQCRKH